MSNIEKIRAEIERRKEEYKEDRYRSDYRGQISYYKDEIYDDLLSFIDSLPDENNPEPYNPVYDEDYLNEKIAKATKSWEGVDVDKMLAECRGYEEKPSEDLEEAAKEYMKKARKHLFDDSPIGRTDDAFIAGAEWQKERDTREMVMSDGSYFQKSYALGKKDMKEEMLKEAVEGEVVQDLHGKFNVKTNAVSDILYQFGDKVKVIILKQ